MNVSIIPSFGTPMTTRPAQPREHALSDAHPVRLVSAELQSFWGFDVGDQLGNWAIDAAGEDGHAVLRSLQLDQWSLLRPLVWAFLVPSVEQDLDPTVIEGIQTTVVTRSVAGTPVNLDTETAIPTTPAHVDVPAEAVVAVGQLDHRDITGALRVAVAYGAFGEAELLRALRSPNDRLRSAALRVSPEVDVEGDTSHAVEPGRTRVGG